MRSPGPEEDPREDESQHGGGTEYQAGESGRRGRFRGRKKQKKKGSFWKELPILIVTALALTILIQAFIARVYVIPSQSMEDTLHGCPGCSNDRILVDKITYLFSEPEPGDVVVFRGPDTWMQNSVTTPEPANPVAGFFREVGGLLGFPTPSEKDFVKRVVATEGQTVSCCDKQNRVLVNGEPLHEPYLHWAPGKGTTQEPFKPVTVPENHIWVMGDNRNNSADSRYQGGGGVDGAVPVDNVIGKAQVIVLPPTRWQSIPEPNPQAMSVGSLAPASQPMLPSGGGVAVVIPALWAGRRGTGLASALRAREHHGP